MRVATVLAVTAAVSTARAELIDATATMTTRHDVADAAPDIGPYIALASAFPSVGVLNGAGGTLIASNWVLTAAHVVLAAPGDNTFVIGGQSYIGAAVAVAPGWTGSLVAGNDIALIRLATHVLNVAPVAYGAFGGEVGRVGTMVGPGLSGTGLTGATGPGGTMRGGRNVLDATAGVFNGPATPPGQLFSDQILVTDFDNPLNDAANTTGDNFLGSHQPLDLEFNVAAGDSGGGLFINYGGGFVLAGVTSFTAQSDGTQNSDYGDFSGFTRTSSWATWIQQQTSVSPAAVPEPSSAALLACVGAAFGVVRRVRRRAA